MALEERGGGWILFHRCEDESRVNVVAFVLTEETRITDGNQVTGVDKESENPPPLSSASVKPGNWGAVPWWRCQRLHAFISCHWGFVGGGGGGAVMS